MSDLLKCIKSPDDLRNLAVADMPELAQEIRERIVGVVSKNQGHLASNLGVVELTLALHYCFDFRVDRLVWDVGHQCYTHKLLTGRNDRFDTLRQAGGLTGFPCVGESEYDPFTVGHSGTAISTALGLVCAADNQDVNRHVVAVLGDGAVSAGMSFEALNHAGALKKKLLVILNDNRMSISETVGAFSEYLSRIRMTPVYADFKREIRELLNRIPVLGRTMEGALEYLKDALKRSMVPGQMFEELGFTYFGPIDGHDTDLLIKTLQDVKQKEGPILLHVLTVKGKGFDPAVTDPAKFHSAKAFEYEDGTLKEQALPSRRSYTECFSDALLDAAAKDKRVMAITAAMPDGTGLKKFQDRFPDRYFDVGICEQHAVGLAGGIAAGGARPVVAVYSTFLQRAYDQVFHDVCLQKLPVILALDRAGVVGADGPTHHGLFDIAYLRNLPHLVLMAPRDGEEFAAMMEFALNHEGPVAIRYPRSSTPEQPLSPSLEPIGLGKPEVLRQGQEAALVAYGSMVQTACDAADLLAGDGIDAAVVNARFAKPIDVDALRAITSQAQVVATLEEHALAGGFGSAVLETLTARGAAPANVLRFGMPDEFVAHGDRNGLLAELGLDAQSVAARVKGAVK